MTFPYLRRRKDVGYKYPRIEVAADSMRVGKTTAVEVIASGLAKKGVAVATIFEDWQHNPYLADSYADPQKSFLLSQKWFVKRKWEQVRDGASDAVYLQDVSPEMDYCYALASYEMGRMNKEQFAKYDDYFHTLDWEVAPAPDLLVYLTVSDSVLIQRANQSRREFEQVDEQYFLTLKRTNRQWLNGANGYTEILQIDTDKLDFAHVEEDKIKLVEMVAKKM